MARLLVRLCIAATALALSGCHDPDSFLSGKWFSENLALPEHAGDAAVLGQLMGCQTEACELFIEMSLGHYGEDVVGVIRFYRDENRVSVTTCEVEGCGCRSIRGVYRNDGVLRFNFVDCSGCLRTAEVVRVTDERLIWTVSHSEDHLDPTSECQAAVRSDASLDITLVKLSAESQITVSDKACSECPL